MYFDVLRRKAEEQKVIKINKNKLNRLESAIGNFIPDREVIEKDKQTVYDKLYGANEK